MMDLSAVLAYFRACYQVDFKAIQVLDFFGRQVHLPMLLESSELLTGQWAQLPVSTVWGEEMDKTLALHADERGLYTCAFFVFGRISVFGKRQKVGAPLYIYPTELVLEKEVYYLKMDTDQGFINPAFVEFMGTCFPNLNLNYTDFAKALPTGRLDFNRLDQLETTLSTFLPGLDIRSLSDFPQILSPDQLKTQSKKRKYTEPPQLLSGLGVGLIKKPSGSRGVMNELQELTRRKDFGPVIRELFNAPKVSGKPKTSTREIFSPAILSKNQLEVLRACDIHKVNMVIGPPGTGKSFTIAALVIDLLLQGKSVLVASRSSQAGKVVAQKIEKDFGLKDAVIQTFSRAFKNRLRNKLVDTLHGLHNSKGSAYEVQQLEKDLLGMSWTLIQAEKELMQREQEEIKWGQFFSQYRGTFFQSVRKKITEYKMANRDPLWQQLKRMHKALVSFQFKSKQYIRKKFRLQLDQALQRDRQQLNTLLQAVEEERGQVARSFFDQTNFEIILRALPIWLVKSADVQQFLPLSSDLFDVVIFDEASQCDVASSLPLLYRAKQAVIVGDHRQLRHLSFLSRQQQQTFARKYGVDQLPKAQINYRESSLLDLVSSTLKSQQQVHFLDEHFRSMPDIIAFSNENFYAGQLKVMTDTPTTIQEKRVQWHQVNGQRDEKGYNEIEAEAILEKLREIVQSEKELHKRLCQTIGILSPFRAQVNLVKQKIRAQFTATELRRHQVLVGTAHQFQGEERDVMFLSFVVDAETHPATFVYLNRTDVFNVSITRARAWQHLFTSVSPGDLSANTLLANYLQSINSQQRQPQREEDQLEQDVFLQEVYQLLKSWKLDRLYIGYTIAAWEIDLVVVREGETYCIDLVGYPGDFASVFPLERWKLLQRMGLKTFAIPYSTWFVDKKVCQRALHRWLFGRKLSS